MVGACREQKSHQTADRAGEHHRADDHALDLDAGVARGALAFADDGDFIAVLAVVEVDVHENGHDRNDQNGQQILLAADDGEPACFTVLVDDADLARALRHFPDDDEECSELGCDVVHHEREERLVGVPLRLEERRKKAPQRACRDGGDEHDENQNAVRKLVAQHDHTCRGGKTADQDLTFCADVPEAHLECGRDGKGDAEQNREVLERDPEFARGAECTIEDGAVDADRVFAREEHRDERADDQRQNNRAAADQHRLIPGQNVSLGDMEQGLFMHRLFLLSRGS